MSADEIRRLADAPAVQFGGRYSPSEKSMIRSALLDFAAMVERCEATIRTLDNGCHKNEVGILRYILKGATDGTKH